MLIYLAIPVTTFRVKALLYATLQLTTHVHLQESEQGRGYCSYETRYASPSLGNDTVVWSGLIWLKIVTSGCVLCIW
jgi:hypothetical protein